MTQTEIIFLAIAALAFLGLNFYRRDWGIVVFVALLPVYLVRFVMNVPGLPALPTTFLEALFLAMFLPWLFERGLKAEAWRGLKRWQKPMALILVGSLVGLLVSDSWLSGLGLWRAYFLEPLLFFALFTDVISTAKERRRVLIAMGLTLLAVGLVAIWQKLTGWNIPNPAWQAAATRRVTFFYGFPNAIGLFAAPVTVIMAAWSVSLLLSKTWRRRWWSIAAAGVAVLGALACLFAVSKGALIGIFVGLVVFGLAYRRLRPVALGLIIVASLGVSLYRPMTNLTGNIFAGRDSSSSVRLIIWDETLDMLADRPFFGGGLSGYPTAIVPYHRAKHIEIFQYPHNLLLNFWTEIGLIGLAGFIWLFILFFVRNAGLVRRGYGWLPLALIAAMSAIVVHGLVDVPYFKNDLAMQFWLLLGLTESLLLQYQHPGVVDRAKHLLHLDRKE